MANSLGVLPAPPPESDLQIPEVYLDFATKTLDFAISRHKRRHHLSVAPETDSKSKARQWIYERVTKGVRDRHGFEKIRRAPMVLSLLGSFAAFAIASFP